MIRDGLSLTKLCSSSRRVSPIGGGEAIVRPIVSCLLELTARRPAGRVLLARSSGRRAAGDDEESPLVNDRPPRFREVSPKVDFPALDARILEFWRRERIFAKSIELRRDAPLYAFYEGPPTANGRPGSHHVLSRVFKDIFPRFKTMRGYRVPRKAGWDCHGLPVELEIERRLGIDGKEQIEEYGIARFNALCRESVLTYLKDWDRMTERIGFWIDLDDAYYTLTNDYIESVWWLLRQIWDKELLYEGFKVVPYCPRCGTAISSHEMAQGYHDVTEPSVYVRFPLTAASAATLGTLGAPVAAGTAPVVETAPVAAETAPAITDQAAGRVSLAVWTTTPWTLVSNVACAVNPEIEYALVESRGERFVLARDLVEAVLGAEAVVERVIAGRELLGLEYEPPYRFVAPDRRAWYVVGDGYVTTTDGTGIVHIAPAFGEDDMRIGHDNDLPVVNPVDAAGRFAAEIEPWPHVFVKDADPGIIADLAARGLLLAEVPYEHSYPFCWRCDTPLLYYSKKTWYVRTTAIKDELLAANEAVTWYPEHIKHGRFGEWLDNNVDWALSRDRYWGTPLPIWRCDQGHVHCVGSIAELRELAVTPPPDDLELHRPFVDEVVLACPECGADMRRAPEVIDAWFDSGSMPFAQWHYPFENKETFRERFPADFIAEAIDQTRGWFYSLLAVATLIEGRSSYETVLCLGHILDADGQKMSKSRGNVVAPDDVLDRQGADAFRWYLFTASSPWYPRRFSLDLVDEVVRKFLLTLWNTYSFFTVYANIDRFDPMSEPVPLAERPLLDRWLAGRLAQLVTRVGDGLEDYDATNSGRAIQEFVDELSNWYVRRSRRRFWKSESDRDKLAAYHTLYECLVTLTKLLAPYTPFVAEELYQNLVRSVDPAAPESVHLCDWPLADEAAVDPAVAFDMEAARRVVELGRAARNGAAVKTRQPLAEVAVAAAAAERAALERLRDIVTDELNVKELRLVSDPGELLDYALKPNLKLLGPRLGRQVGAVGAALRDVDAPEFVAALRTGGSAPLVLADGEQVRLAEDEVLVETVAPAGCRVESDAAFTVSLRTTVDAELRDEGIVRELVHAVQLSRKNADLRIEDTISLALSVPAELAGLVERHAAYIRSETLASELELGDRPRTHRETVRVEGCEVVVGITPTGTIFTVNYG
jgi:isoleucyl-tRNA synthetase